MKSLFNRILQLLSLVEQFIFSEEGEKRKYAKYLQARTYYEQFSTDELTSHYIELKTRKARQTFSFLLYLFVGVIAIAGLIITIFHPTHQILSSDFFHHRITEYVSTFCILLTFYYIVLFLTYILFTAIFIQRINFGGLIPIVFYSVIQILLHDFLHHRIIEYVSVFSVLLAVCFFTLCLTYVLFASIFIQSINLSFYRILIIEQIINGDSRSAIEKQ